MKREIAKRWADALESGEFEQGRELLQDGEGRFCCLGVLCELAVKDGVIIRDDSAGVIISDDSPGFLDRAACYGPVENFETDYSSTFLPADVVAWAGLPEGYEDIYFDVTHIQHKINMSKVADYERHPDGRLIISATALNDTHNLTFADIADLIRSGKMVDPTGAGESMLG